VAGWGAFAYAARFHAETEQRLTEQAAELTRGHEQLLAERDQARAEVADLKASRDQLIAERDEAKAQLAAAREEVTTLQRRLDEAQAKASETGSVRTPAPSGKPARSPAQTPRTRR